MRIRWENAALLAQIDQEKRTVERALAAAQEANTSKSRFLAAASHDLRQPLHALGFFLSRLSMMVEGEEASQLLQRIRVTTDVLNEHFNSLLDLSRFDAGGVEVDRADFDLGTLLRRVVEEMRPEAAAKGLGLSLHVGEWRAYSDELLIERVVRNLLSNAVRYTEKGAVSVIAELADGRVVISVVDTGPGIPEEEQMKVFDEFVQLNNPARRREQGVGLGLAIVRRIDALLGLRLRLRSTVGLGSRFEFELPLASSDSHVTSIISSATPLPLAHDTKGRTLRVWVVEDDTVVAEALDMQLRAWDCEVAVATTREELESEYRLCRAWPDLALIDDMLGEGESGLDIAKWLQDYLPARQIFMVTGNITPGRHAEIAADGFPLILKPMSPQRLAELLEVVRNESALKNERAVTG